MWISKTNKAEAFKNVAEVDSKEDDAPKDGKFLNKQIKMRLSKMLRM